MTATCLARRVAVIAVGLVAACGSVPVEPQTSSAARFLSRYVRADGRVIRTDQGDDIVSEGQAYGMLIAELGGRPDLARTIWRWSDDHLRRPDGLYAWHATGSGTIEDPQSSGDADVLMAYALCRFSGPGESVLHAAGVNLAASILDHETVRLSDGTPLLVAGPWATASPPVVNPSYLMPGVFDALGRCTGEKSWTAMASASSTLLDELTDGGRVLPPDWAELQGGRLVASAQPGGGAGIQYGLDAARVPVFLASSCDPGSRRLAASLWDAILSKGERTSAIALTLAGATIDAARNPLTLVAGASAARAAGSVAVADRLLGAARSESLEYPTYYGDAWLVLGEAMAAGSLAPCKENVNG